MSDSGLSPFSFRAIHTVRGVSTSTLGLINKCTACRPQGGGSGDRDRKIGTGNNQIKSKG